MISTYEIKYRVFAEPDSVAIRKCNAPSGFEAVRRVHHELARAGKPKIKVISCTFMGITTSPT